MVDESLVRAIAEIAIFLEFADNETVDEDASVEALEQLAATLQKASAETQRNLAATFAAIAPNYPDHRDFVAKLADHLGLLGDAG